MTGASAREREEGLSGHAVRTIMLQTKLKPINIQIATRRLSTPVGSRCSTGDPDLHPATVLPRIYVNCKILIHAKKIIKKHSIVYKFNLSILIACLNMHLKKFLQ
ncbi:hypothetical protein ACJX0J_023767, partial [Zea mays]